MGAAETRGWPEFRECNIRKVLHHIDVPQLEYGRMLLTAGSPGLLCITTALGIGKPGVNGDPLLNHGGMGV